LRTFHVRVCKLRGNCEKVVAAQLVVDTLANACACT